MQIDYVCVQTKQFKIPFKDDISKLAELKLQVSQKMSEFFKFNLGPNLMRIYV